MATLSAQRQDQSYVTELVLAARGGDRAAWRTLFDLYQPIVFAASMMACNRNREAAKELTQDVFVRAVRGIDGLKNPARFKAWIMTITYNLSRNRWSAQASNRRAIAGYYLEQDVHLSTDDKVARKVRITLVREALEGIEDEQMRRIALLKYTEPEHTTRQISEKLGIPHGTVTTKLMRFRARFKSVLVAALAEEASRV